MPPAAGGNKSSRTPLKRPGGGADGHGPATPKGGPPTPKGGGKATHAAPKGGGAPKGHGGTPKATPRKADGAAKSGKAKEGGSSAETAAEEASRKRKALAKAASALTTERLQEIADAHLAQAKEYEALKGTFQTLATRVGDELAKKVEDGMPLSDIFAILDKNGDKKITKMEFRTGIKKLDKDLAAYTTEEVDALYDRMDKDHDGELVVKELGLALKELPGQARAMAAREAEALAKGQACRERAEAVVAQLEVVKVWEEAAKELELLKVNGPPVEARLGALLLKKNLKPTDVFAKWDADGNGAIDRAEFDGHLKQLGLEATDEELAHAFTLLDIDGNGEIDYEVRACARACARAHTRARARAQARVRTACMRPSG